MQTPRLATLTASQLGDLFDGVEDGSGATVRQRSISGGMLVALLKNAPHAGSSVSVETRRILSETCGLATETPDLTISRYVAALNSLRNDV